MEETRMLELADQLIALREKRDAVQDELKGINADIEATEAAMIEIMTAEECAGFKRGNRTFSLVIREYPGAVPENKAQLYEEMRSHGFDHIFTINPMILSATVKELKTENNDVLPEWLDGLVRVFEKASISVRKS